MLMLGESVLQLSVSTVSLQRHPSDPESSYFWATFIGGALIAVCQLHVHIETAPHDPKDHAFSVSTLHGSMYYAAFCVKARAACPPSRVALAPVRAQPPPR